MSKLPAFVKELNSNWGADGICPSASCLPPWECSERVPLTVAFKREAPSHKQACIKLMEHICKKLLYTLKTERINLFNKLLGFPSDADWSNIIEMCIVVSNFTGTNRKCQEDSFVKWKHFTWFFFYYFYFLVLKIHARTKGLHFYHTDLCNNCILPGIFFNISSARLLFASCTCTGCHSNAIKAKAISYKQLLSWGITLFLWSKIPTIYTGP